MNSKTTISLSTVAIAAAIVLFTSAPLVAPHQAQAYWGGGAGITPAGAGTVAGAGVTAAGVTAAGVTAAGKLFPLLFFIFHESTSK
jgi:hypothetical protein